MSIISYGFSWGAAPLPQMKLDLDQSRPNEKVFLDYLRAGISFEPDVANAFVTLLHVGDVAVDIGANCGFFTVPAAMLVGPTGHVVRARSRECRATSRQSGPQRLHQRHGYRKGGNQPSG
jgi:hypothetical protein